MRPRKFTDGDFDNINAELPWEWHEWLVLEGDKHSPRMRPAEYSITPHGVQIRCYWAHEGQIKSEWLPAHLLVTAEDQSS